MLVLRSSAFPVFPKGRLRCQRRRRVGALIVLHAGREKGTGACATLGAEVIRGVQERPTLVWYPRKDGSAAGRTMAIKAEYRTRASGRRTNGEGEVLGSANYVCAQY